MRVLSSRKGFSLVELLTVIAIIAILASIIFPVMAMVSNKARMDKCITQLHQIGLGLQVFKQDNRRYPDILGTTVQYKNTVITPWEQTRGAAVGVMGLFPEYVGSCRLYHCPNSKNTDTSAYDRYDPNEYDPTLAGQQVDVYSYDSYDVMNLGSVASPVIQQHYARCWAGNIAAVSNGTMKDAPTDPAADYERQLKFRTPPDTTVVTWCSWHEVGGSGKVPTLFLDGHVDSLPAGDVENFKWRVLPRRE